MPHQLHLALMFVGEFVGFIAGAVVGLWLWVGKPFDLSMTMVILITAAAVVVGVMTPRTIFRHLIPARCPAEGCAGVAFPRGSKPIVYRCRRSIIIRDGPAASEAPDPSRPPAIGWCPACSSARTSRVAWAASSRAAASSARRTTRARKVRTERWGCLATVPPRE